MATGPRDRHGEIAEAGTGVPREGLSEVPGDLRVHRSRSEGPVPGGRHRVRVRDARLEGSTTPTRGPRVRQGHPRPELGPNLPRGTEVRDHPPPLEPRGSERDEALRRQVEEWASEPPMDGGD